MSKTRNFYQAVLTEASETITRDRLHEIFKAVNFGGESVFYNLVKRKGVFRRDGNKFHVNYNNLRDAIASSHVTTRARYYNTKTARRTPTSVHGLKKAAKTMTLADGRTARLTTLEAWVID